ncbi:MAG: S8 family serine peptidase [Burkholderiaceae bacterium]|nr:S8 family serine peptidase [Burkholderiaceae bacterium]
MDLLTRFTVLVERSRIHRRLICLVAGVLASAAALVAAPAHARDHEVARDLQDAVDAPTTPSVGWARDLNGHRMVQVLVVSNSTDPAMTALRAFIVQSGGSVQKVHPATHALTVIVPASVVGALAQRSDVVSVAPNRPTHRTNSTLEMIAGALTSHVRGNSTKTSYSGVDGSGVGIAILDSGVMKSHDAFLNSSGVTRVMRNVSMLNSTAANWTTGTNSTTSLMPGSSALASYESAIANDTVGTANNYTQDPFGHGTHVASVAAGFSVAYSSTTPDTTGIAPNANIYDVQVLNGTGTGTISDAIEGIEWVIYHSQDYNIRVINISLAADSTQTWQTDPFCAAVRSATAAGITVVVAAGNFGLSSTNQEVYGTISSPGDDPSVITVGAVNYHNSLLRSADTVDFFSSRGPTRGSYVDGNGVTQYDNLLKPDLVAPGNLVVSAAATKAQASNPAWNYLAANYYSTLVTPLNIPALYPETQMLLSGTSISAPVVSGAVALMVQKNPALTPPLIKTILQYTAQPIPGYNLLEQGAGLLNIDGAMMLTRLIRNDLSTAIAAGTINPGDNMMTDSMPSKSSTINNATFNWSRIAFFGGDHIFSGSSLFTKYQPIYDPRTAWASNVVRFRQPIYWSGSGIAANTYVQNFTDTALTNQTLMTSGVTSADTLVGTSDPAAQTGMFVPTATLSGWLASGSGTQLSQGDLLSNGIVMQEGILLKDSLLLQEGILVQEGILHVDGLVINEGNLTNESGGSVAGYNTSGALHGEP